MTLDHHFTTYNAITNLVRKTKHLPTYPSIASILEETENSNTTNQ